MNHSFDLDVIEFGGPGGQPVVYVYLKNFGVNNVGHSCITPDCFYAEEFDANIDRLHEELENVRRRGLKLFATPQH